MIGRGTSKLRRTLLTALSAAALTLAPVFVSSVALAAPETTAAQHATEAAAPKAEASGEAKSSGEKKAETKAKAKKSGPKGERSTKHATAASTKKGGKKRAHSKSKGSGPAAKQASSSSDSGGILLTKPAVNEPEPSSSEGPTKRASVSPKERGRGVAIHARVHEKGASRASSSTKHASTKGSKASKHETKVASHDTKPASHDTKVASHETKPASHDTKPANHEAKPSKREPKSTSHDTKPASHDTKPASHETKSANHETKVTGSETKVASSRSTKASKRASSRAKSSKRREKKGERGGKESANHPCFGPAVTLDRAGLEPENFPLVTCSGSPLAEARDRLSLLARPWGLIRPDRAASTAADVPRSRGAKSSHDHEVDPIEVAPGVRRLDEGLVTRVAAVSRKFPGKLVSIVSGYRPQSRGSLHQAGRAIDLRVAGVTNVDLVAFCKTLPDTGCGFYPNSSFVHIDVRTPGTGGVSWIDASGPGEGPRYVSSWPETARQAPPFAPPSQGDGADGGHEARATRSTSPHGHSATTTTASTTSTTASTMSTTATTATTPTRPASCVEPSAPSSSNARDEGDLAPLFEDPPY